MSRVASVECAALNQSAVNSQSFGEFGSKLEELLQLIQMREKTHSDSEKELTAKI